MAPTRTSKAHRQNEHSQPNRAGPSKPRDRRNFQEKEPTGVPGVQKIKSSLRQTRRLLAKDNLAADVRIETERRLKALEAELVEAESSRKERALAVRYHKIKFFERQKVVRKLNQTKKQLASEDTPAKTELESKLSDLRVDLNYILHYPKTKKYISLFPPEIRQNEGKIVPASLETEVAKTTASRDEVRSWIQERMDAGELSNEPELHLDSRGATTKDSTNWDVKAKPSNLSKVTDTTDSLEKDAFFEDDNEVDDE